MKPLLIISGGALVLLNAMLLASPSPAVQDWAPLVQGISVFGGFVALIGAFRSGSRAASMSALSVEPPPPAPPRAEAEVVAFLALLQEKGRLVDFVKEEIAGASDEAVGAAARVIHEGCRKVISECFEIAPVRSEGEGSPVTLDAGFDTGAHRLLGSVPDLPPYRGRLVHPGWEVRSVRLPKVLVGEGRQWPVVAPAEVEIAKN